MAPFVLDESEILRRIPVSPLLSDGYPWDAPQDDMIGVVVNNTLLSYLLISIRAIRPNRDIRVKVSQTIHDHLGWTGSQGFSK
jgi:hypothetical protein